MKRLTIILIAAALLIGSCSQAGKTRPKIGLAMRSFDDPISVAVRRSIETEALDKADLAIIDGQNQQAAQNLQTASFFERKLASLAIDPVDVSGLSEIIGKAKTDRTPVVFFDRMPSEEAMRSWDKLYFVGTRSADVGTALGQMLAAVTNANPAVDRDNDGRVKYILLTGDVPTADAALLAEGCAKAIGAAGAKAERLLFDGSGQISAASPRDAAAAYIAKFGNKIEAVLCADESSTLGALDAFKAAGYLKVTKAIPILGAGEGALPPQMTEALRAGSLAGAAVSDEESEGRAVFDLAYALAKGSDPSKAGWRISDAKYVWIPFRAIAGSALPALSK